MASPTDREQPEASGQALVERLREALTAIKSTLGDLDTELGPRVNAAYELAREALDALSTASPAPSDAPQNDYGKRLMLNAYGRQCWNAGYESAKAEQSASPPGERPDQGLIQELRVAVLAAPNLNGYTADGEADQHHAYRVGFFDAQRGAIDQIERALASRPTEAPTDHDLGLLGGTVPSDAGPQSPRRKD